MPTKYGEHSELNNVPVNANGKDASISNIASPKVYKPPKKNLSKITTMAVIALIFVVVALVGKGGNSKNENREIEAWVCAQDVVRSSLKSPASAKFCSYTEATVSCDYGADYTIRGYVDAQNGFGATIRSYFVVTLTLTEKGYTNGYVVFS